MKTQASILIKRTYDYLDNKRETGKIAPFTPYGFKEALLCFNDVVRDGEAKTQIEDVACWFVGQGWNVKENPIENGWIIDCYL